jgi:hypothetical protein
MTSGDPVAVGLVPGLAQPQGNITGFSTQAAELEGKRLELVNELIADVSRVVVLSNPSNPYCSIAAHPWVPVLLSAVRNGREPGAGVRAEARQQPPLAVMGLCSDCIRRLCCDAAYFGRVRGNIDGDVQPADDLPELDLRGSQVAARRPVRPWAAFFAVACRLRKSAVAIPAAKPSPQRRRADNK